MGVSDSGERGCLQILSLCKAASIATPQAGIVFWWMWNFKDLAQQQNRQLSILVSRALETFYK